jgi:cell division protein FtsW (lipid II flippase)
VSRMSRVPISVAVSGGLAALAFGLIVYTLAQPWGRIGSGDALGAGFVPLITLTGLLVFSLLATREPRRESDELLSKETFGFRIAVVTGLSWAFGYSLDHFGMVVSTPPYLALSLAVWGARGWWRIALVVAGVTLALFIFYVRLFHRLPE